MIVWTFVVGKEVSSSSIGYALGQEEPERQGFQLLHHGFGYKHDAPPHNQIDGQRKSWPASKGNDFIYCSYNDNYPL